MSPVNWDATAARREAQERAREELLRLGFAVEAQAKVNVTENGQIDTGFMRSGIYTVGQDESTYGSTDPSGLYDSQKSGATVDREIAPELTAGEDEVLVVTGAAYSIYQEMEISFMYSALDQVRSGRPT